MAAQQQGTLKTLPVGELVEDYRLYPRRAVDGATVEEFREALRAGAKFPPIRVCSKTLRIIDGFHRATAYRRELATHVLCSLEEVADDAELFRRAMAANASHGRRYSVHDYEHAVMLAKRLGLSREQISADLFLPLERVSKLERMCPASDSSKPERNLPTAKGGGRSRLQEKSFDTISQVTWVNSLRRCLKEDLINDQSEELREGLEELSVLLGRYLDGAVERKARAARPKPERWVRLSGEAEPRVKTPAPPRRTPTRAGPS